MEIDDALLREFLLEVKENLDKLDQGLVQLEARPDDREILDEIFRSLHSTKGAAGFFGFDRLESVAHAGENLLNSIRDGSVALDRPAASTLLGALDALREIVSGIESTGAEPRGDYAAVLGNMSRLMAGVAAQALERPPERPARASPEPRDARSERAEAPPAPVSEPARDPPPVDSSAQRAGPPDAAPGERPAVEAADTIRVDVRLLDELMDLVGELVLSRNQILRNTASRDALDQELAQSTEQLDRITTEIQERVMKTRMQPIRQVWSKFPRVVRDLSVQLGKRVRLEMEGEETELDRSLVEAIKDPMTHLVRNAVDHGIEPPAARIAAGKPEEGRFVLRAYHESGQVVIEAEDDGAGIDVERLKARAVERGLVTAAEASSMRESEALRLVFRPGLSTAREVTKVSGRGVGMDVVKSNIERIGGTIEVESRPRAGTTIRVKIPLTLAIVPALLVTAGGARFAIPQTSVLELIRVKREDAPRAIESVHGTLATRLRGKILPLVELSALLSGERERASWDRTVSIVVLQANQRKFGLLVDAIEESQEIVVKPLSRQLADLRIFAGATILGDGSIALILDTQGVAFASRVLSETEEWAAERHASASETREPTETLLLVETSQGGRAAIPLAAVARLEKFDAKNLERAGDDRCVQYRNEVMRLVTLDSVLAGRRGDEAPDAGLVEVVVFQSGERRVGVVVRRILDIVETPLASLAPASRPGARGTAIVRDRVTEILDLEAVAHA